MVLLIRVMLDVSLFSAPEPTEGVIAFEAPRFVLSTPRAVHSLLSLTPNTTAAVEHAQEVNRRNHQRSLCQRNLPAVSDPLPSTRCEERPWWKRKGSLGVVPATGVFFSPNDRTDQWYPIVYGGRGCAARLPDLLPILGWVVGSGGPKARKQLVV